MENKVEQSENTIEVFEDKTIMLVEDEEPYRKYMAKVIEKYIKCKVIQCPNPKIAFEHLSTVIPDLIIMDLQMPMMDGLTAVKHIRASERTAKIPVIICSALGFESIIKTMGQYKVYDFIVKPAEPQIIIKKVTKIFKGN